MTDYSTIKVLVAEDEFFIRTTIRNQLRQIGIRNIVEAGDGSQALQELMGGKPDLILCDIHMKPKNGFEFIVALRGMPDKALANLPVVFLTADAQKDSVMFAKEYQADGYLVKPVSTKALKDRIDAVLKKKTGG